MNFFFLLILISDCTMLTLRFSSLYSHTSMLRAHTSHRTSHISHLAFHISHCASPISHLPSPISFPISIPSLLVLVINSQFSILNRNCMLPISLILIVLSHRHSHLWLLLSFWCRSHSSSASPFSPSSLSRSCASAGPLCDQSSEYCISITIRHRWSFGE